MPPTDTADHDTKGQDDTADLDHDDGTAAGDLGDGAEESDPADSTAGAKKRDPAAKRTKPDSTTDDESAGFSESDIDDIIAAAEPEKAADDDKPAQKDDEAETDDDAEADESEAETDDDEAGDDAEAKDETDEGEKKPEDELEPTPEERARLSKKVNGQIDRLLKIREELEPAAKFGQQVHEHAITNGKMTVPMLKAWVETGVRVNTGNPADAVKELVDLALNVETKGKAKTMKAAERANLLRRLADRIAPAPKAPEPEPLIMPTDLADLVEAGTISKATAVTEARARLAKDRPAAKQAEPEPEEPAAEEEPETEVQPRDEHLKKAQADYDAGLKGATDVYAEYALKYKADWKRIEPEVIKRVTERSANVLPAGFAKLVRDQMEVVVARFRKAVPPAPKSPRPQSSGKQPDKKPAGKLNDDPDDWSDVVGLATGKNRR